MTEESHAATGHDEAHEEPNMILISVYLGVLTVATFGTLALPPAIWGRVTNTLFVLMIAFCKASLVVGFFMHFKYEKVWKYFLCLPPCVLGVIAIVALLPDVGIGTWPKLAWNQ